MKTYRVGVEYTIYDELHIEAKNRKEAEKLAKMEAESENPDHYSIDYIEEE